MLTWEIVLDEGKVENMEWVLMFWAHADTSGEVPKLVCADCGREVILNSIDDMFKAESDAWGIGHGQLRCEECNWMCDECGKFHAPGKGCGYFPICEGCSREHKDCECGGDDAELVMDTESGGCDSCQGDGADGDGLPPYFYKTALCVVTEEWESFGSGEPEPTAGGLQMEETVVSREQCAECESVLNERPYGEIEFSALSLVQSFLDEHSSNSDRLDFIKRVKLDCTEDMGDGSITLHDHRGMELVHWTEDEWKEDPTIVMAICNAIKMLLTEGEDALKKFLKITN